MLGLCNASLLSSFTVLVVDFVVFCLSMVVWQPFEVCLRYIIARVSEMHVAYHNKILLVGYLHHRNDYNKTRPLHLLSLFSSYLRSIVPAVEKEGSKHWGHDRINDRMNSRWTREGRILGIYYETGSESVFSHEEK